MSRQHLVRIGTLGEIGRFTSVDATRYPRGARVVCRTSRGLEVGEVLMPPEDDGEASPADGSLLRGMTVADELLVARLERHRDEAYQACAALLAKRGIEAVLMDVEQLFDGRSLFFYFLGEVTPALEAVTEELAATYETKVQFRRFAEALTHGCGPGCGTDQAQGAGCSDGACTSCTLARACASKR